jgi:hypothetical protein
LFVIFSKASSALMVKVGALVLGTSEQNEQNIEILSVAIYPSYDDHFKLNDLALVNVRFTFFLAISLYIVLCNN